MLTLPSSFVVNRLEMNPSGDQVIYQNVQIAAIFGLSNREWIDNWDFLMQTLLHYADKRAGNPNSDAHGGLSAAVILEKILEKRKLLPEKFDATIPCIVAVQRLEQIYTVDKRWEDVIRVGKLHLEEVQRLETGRVPEQASNVCMSMAVGANMLGRGKEAEQYLDQAWSYLALENLPPHRFKAQLYALIERAHHSQLLDRPPEGSLNLLQYAYTRFLKLADDIPHLEHDHPWERIIEGIQTSLEEQLKLTETRVRQKAKQKRDFSRKQAQTMKSIEHYFSDYVNNPDATPEQRIHALEELSQIPSLSATERQKIQRMLRRIRALQALGDDYSPIPMDQRPKRQPNGPSESDRANNSPAM